MVLLDMEMPKGCDDCSYCGSDYKCKNHVDQIYRKDVSKYIFNRHPDCPLREVPVEVKSLVDVG